MGKLFKKNDLKRAAVTGLGMTTGIAAGGAFGSLIERHLPEYRKVGKVGLALLGGVGFALANDKDDLGKAAAFASLGVAAKNMYDLVIEQVQPSIDVKAVADRSFMDDMLYGAVGLACPCGTNGPALAAPSISFQNDFNPSMDIDWEEQRGVASLLAPYAEKEVSSLI